jgi:hypothetical protein
MRKNFNIPSPKSQSPKKDPAPKARRPLQNPDASPHANRLARLPRFPEICEEDEDAPKDNNRCQSPTPVTRRKKPRSTSSASQHHVLARPSSFPPPLLQVPIVATIQVDIDESLLRQNKKRISWPVLSRSVAATQALDLLAPPPRAARHPLPCEHLAPCSARRYGGTLDLQKRKKSTQRSTDTGELVWTMM